MKSAHHLRILTVIFHTEEGLHTRNIGVNGQFWHFSIIISWIINLIFYFQVSRITNDFLVFLFDCLYVSLQWIKKFAFEKKQKKITIPTDFHRFSLIS